MAGSSKSELAKISKLKKYTINKTFCFNPILIKLGQVVVHMGTTTSPIFIKIGIKPKKFY